MRRVSIIVGLSLCCGSAQAAEVPQAILMQISNRKIELAVNPEHVLVDALAARRSIRSNDPSPSMPLAFQDWSASAALVNLNRPTEAQSLVQEGLAAVQEEAAASSLNAELLLVRASIASRSGNVQSYIRDYHRAYLYFRTSSNLRGQAVALQNIAAAYLDAGDNETVLRYCRQTLTIYAGDDVIVHAIYNNLGVALIGLGRPKAAEVAFVKALGAARKRKSPFLIAQVLLNLAQSQLDSGELGKASATVSEALQLSSNGPQAIWRPALYGIAADLALGAHDRGLAKAWIERAFSNEALLQNASSVRHLHETAYKVYQANGDPGAALHHLELFKKLDDKARALAASTNAALMSARFDFANQDLKIAQLRTGQAERDAALARSQGRYHSMLISSLAFISVLLALGFVSIRRSRNEVRAANRELQGTNAELERALAAKSIFLATTSHEIRTPLNGILGMTQVLLADRAVVPDVRSRVQLIHGAGETMRALVDDILDMAKMETGELRLHPGPMDLRRLLEEAGAVWTGQAQTKRIELQLRLDDCPVGIVADEVRLRQIVFNLMSNAIKFTDRGQVRLSARTEEGDEGERLVMVVADTGIGIPPDRLAEIFEAFRQVDGGVTRRHGGTGLGLAICRNLARAMGGDVDVESVPGTGSTFTVTLPLERATLEPAPRAISAAAGTLADAQLLLLEPNPLAQGILRAFLTPHVGGLEMAADAEAAAALLEKRDIQHLLVDAAAFQFDAPSVLRFLEAHRVPHATLLWPSPGADVQAAIAADPTVRLLAKPIAAPDLLAGLRMSYQGASVGRDIAA